MTEAMANPVSPTVSRRTTLKDALSMMLDADVQTGIVVDRTGAALGPAHDRGRRRADARGRPRPGLRPGGDGRAERRRARGPAGRRAHRGPGAEPQADARPEPVDLSIDWGWLASHVDDMYERFLQHLQLVVIAVVAGFVISLVLGIWAYPPAPRVYGRIIRRRRAPLHDPQPGGVRAPPAVHRPDARHGPHPAHHVHAADPGAGERRPASTRCRPTSSRRPRAWATPVASDCSASSCRSPCR